MRQQKGRLGKRLTAIARHQPAPQAGAREDGSAPLDVVGAPRVDCNAECPAGSDQQSGDSKDDADQNGLEEIEQGEAPLQPIEAIAFPRCDAAVRNWEANKWELADAILAECSETGADGVRNDSYAKMEAMRVEIAKNHGVEISFERVRKLRKAGSAFPPGRRRPGVSIEGHLEAGTPEALDEIIAKAPQCTAPTREFIRRAKHPEEKAGQQNQKEERRRHVEDQRKVLQDLCTQLQRQNEAQEQRYSELCRTTGTKPKPLLALPPEEGTSRAVAEALEQSLRVLLTLHGLDPAATSLKEAIRAFVTTVLERP
jgi:hypothetical protein